MSDILKVAEAMLEWIDAMPKDMALPAMPGFDRDWAECVLEAAREEQRSKEGGDERAASSTLMCRPFGSSDRRSRNEHSQASGAETFQLH